MSLTDNMTRADAIALLGLTEPIDAETVKKSYRKLCHQVHADKGGTDALFRIVHHAYEILNSEFDNKSAAGNYNTNTTRTTQTQQTRTTTNQARHERKATWDEIVRKKDFIVPFDTFSRIVLLGVQDSIRYNGYNVNITAENVEHNQIKSKFPLKITVQTWHSWFQSLFKKPASYEEATFDCRNGIRYPDSFGASRYFSSSINCNVDAKGYHVITLEYLGRTQTIKLRTDKSFDTRKEHRKTTLHGVHDIYIDIEVRILTKNS